MAHFNSEADDAYWQASDNLSMLYDTGCNTIASNVSHGGDAIYNTLGVRLTKAPAHGIYIKGGQKYVR